MSGGEFISHTSLNAFQSIPLFSRTLECHVRGHYRGSTNRSCQYHIRHCSTHGWAYTQAQPASLLPVDRNSRLAVCALQSPSLLRDSRLPATCRLLFLILEPQHLPRKTLKKGNSNSVPPEALVSVLFCGTICPNRGTNPLPGLVLFPLLSGRRPLGTIVLPPTSWLREVRPGT